MLIWRFQLTLLVVVLSLGLAAAPPALAQSLTPPPAGDSEAESTEQAEPEPPPVPAELASPRATFGTFLSAMGKVKKGNDAALEQAIATLDLSDAPAAVQDEVGEKAARTLSTFLDKTELVNLSRIPDSLDTGSYVWRRYAEGNVSLTKAADGRWLFSNETLEALDALAASVRNKEFVEGIEGPGEANLTFADSIRSRLPESMTNRLILLENWQWLALLVLIVAGVVLDRLVRFVVVSRVRKLLEAISEKIDTVAALRFQQPMGILIMATLWSFMLPALDLPIGVLTVIGTAVQLVMAAAAVWVVYRLVDLLTAYFAVLAEETESKLDDLLVPMVRRALKIFVVAFGLVFIAQNLDIDVTSLIAGVGLGGLAFALAAKDTIENLFGSLTVIMDKPFQIGDWIVLGDLEGTVVEVGFRSTKIRTFYNSVITVPNSKLVSAAVDNLGAREWRRIKCMISVTYDTPPEKIEAFCEGMRELVRRHPYTRKDYYNIYFNEFGASGLNILFYVFHSAPDWTTELRERHRLFMDVVRLAHRLGIEFAFPTQTIHIASSPESAAASPEAGASEPRAMAHEKIVTLGREQAEAIVRDSWGHGSQPPVDFKDPDRIRPTEFS